MADKSSFHSAVRAFFSACCAASLMLPAVGQDNAALKSPVPLEVQQQVQDAPLQGQAKQEDVSLAPLQGQAKQEQAKVAPLEGKLEQTAPIQGGLSDEELKLRSMNGALDPNNALKGGADAAGQPTKLQGRLEQIGQPNPELPVELTSAASKNQPLADIKFIRMTPKLDLTQTQTVLKGGLTNLSAMTSLPDFLVGTWGGHLKVLTRNIVNPDIADARLVVDELGTVVVRFVKEDQDVNALPATIFFQRRIVDRLHHMMRREPDANVKEDLKSTTFNDYPMIDLGTKHWHNAVGTQWQDRVLHNSLQRIGDNGAEQDVVFERTKDGALYGYRETVVRYTWVSKTDIFMQVAVVDFAPDRSLRKRTTLEGHISPAWHPFATEISGIATQPWADIVKLYDLNIYW